MRDGRGFRSLDGDLILAKVGRCESSWGAIQVQWMWVQMGPGWRFRRRVREWKCRLWWRIKLNPVRRITAPAKTGQTPRKEGCGTEWSDTDRGGGRDKTREVVRDHGLVIFRIGPNASAASTLCREFLAEEGCSREESNRQFVSGGPPWVGGSLMRRFRCIRPCCVHGVGVRVRSGFRTFDLPMWWG